VLFTRSLAALPFFPFTTLEIREVRRSDLLRRGVSRRGARAAWVIIPESVLDAWGGLVDAVEVTNRSEDADETSEARRRHGESVQMDAVAGVLHRDGPGGNEQAVRDALDEFVGQTSTSPLLLVSSCSRQRAGIFECVGPSRRDVSWRELLFEHHGPPELGLRNPEEATWRDSSLDVVAS